jgi:hypothetical protein
MSLIKMASFNSNLVFQLINFLQNRVFQPPQFPNHGGLIDTGGHPQDPTRKNSGLLFQYSSNILDSTDTPYETIPAIHSFPVSFL